MPTQPEKLSIRAGRPGDLETLVQYNLALARETESLTLDAAVLRSGVEKALARPESSRYFVAEAKEKVIGQTMVTFEWSDWRDGFIWWLQSVYVHPDHRSQGVFHKIYSHIEQEARKDQAARAIRLYVMEDNARGMGAYKKAGLAPSGYVVYERELE